MADVTMRRMLEAGVHFGHQTRFWNPKMAAIHLRRAQQDPHHQPRPHGAALQGGERVRPQARRRRRHLAVRRLEARGARSDGRGGRALRHALVTQRWLGGMLTNFKTIRQSIKRLKTLEEITEPGATFEFTKKEMLGLGREKEKLERTLGGIKNMDALPTRRVPHRRRPRGNRRSRGAQARHSRRRHRRHELLARGHRLPDPGQRRRDARHSALR